MGLALKEHGPDEHDWSTHEGHSSTWAVKKSVLDKQSNDELKAALKSLEDRFQELAMELAQHHNSDERGEAAGPRHSLIEIHRALSRHVINTRKIEEELRSRGVDFEVGYLSE